MVSAKTAAGILAAADNYRNADGGNQASSSAKTAGI